MLAELFNAALGLTLTLFLPGIPMTLALYPKKGLEHSERIMLSIILSISSMVVAGYVLNNFIGVELSALNLFIVTVFLSITFTAAYSLRLKGLPTIYLETHEYDLAKVLRMLSLVSLIALNALYAYSPHLGYQYPMSLEEWKAVSSTLDSMEKNSFGSGFSILLAEITLFTGQDLVPLYRFLPALFSMVTALGTYVFARKMTGSFNAGLLSLLFLPALLTSQVFFTPQTLSYVFMCFVIYLIASALHRREREKMIPFVMSFLALALIHPPALLITVLVVSAYILANPALLRGDRVLAATLLAALVMVSVPLVTGLSRSYSAPGNPISLSPGLVTASFLSLIALAAIHKEKKKGQEMLSTWLLIMAAFFFLSGFLGIKPSLDYLILSLTVLGGVGLYSILSLVSKRGGRQSLMLVVSLILLASSAMALYSSYRLPAREMQESIDKETYEALKWLSYRGVNESIIFSRPQIAPACFVARKQASNASTEDVYSFFMSMDCSEKEAITSKYNASYILMNQGQYLDCERYREIYYDEGVYIYQVQ